MTSVNALLDGVDLASVRLRGKDRALRATGFYRHLEDPEEVRRLKETARIAFIAYNVAVRDGDDDLADATLARFLAATDRLSPDAARLCRKSEAAA